MSRIDDVFQKHAVTGSTLFLPYLCAGDPDIETSLTLMRETEAAGADILEIGIPFSDPLADGPTIQKAIQRSLQRNTRISDVFSLVEHLREDSELPLVLMSYYNPIFRYGEQRFVKDAREAGADGVLVVDLPPEEGQPFFDHANQQGLDTVLLATPTTGPERVRELSQLGTGFLYYVTVTGVTGVRSGFNQNLSEQIRSVSHQSELPMVMGFGVSEIEPIRPYLDAVQGVVAGSTLVEKIEENIGDTDAMIEALGSKVRSLAEPLHGAVR